MASGNNSKLNLHRMVVLPALSRPIMMMRI